MSGTNNTPGENGELEDSSVAEEILKDAINNIYKGPLPETSMNQGDFKRLQEIEARLFALYQFINTDKTSSTDKVSFTKEDLRRMQEKVETGYLSTDEIARINRWREEAVKILEK